ncbi:hypothetical protein AAC03nite_20150 [Alicyclobacillus acidoterrestris]|nr:hypothetical protein AAC03nite_20150 [Alicyclobacillus acidoterrestris]
MAEEASQTQSSAPAPASVPAAPPAPTPSKSTTNASPTPQAESIYTKDELLDAAKALGTTRAVVAGAMHFAGKDRMTKSEAKKVIAAFLQRKV